MKKLPGVDFAAPVAGPREFGLATRNPFNRGGFKTRIAVYRLNPE